jgi:two-component system chemotaxis response regulator CheY
MHAEPSFWVVDDLSARRRIVYGLLRELADTKISEADSGAAALRVLASSAPPVAKKDNITAAAEAGADGYTVKSFNAAVLKQQRDKILLKRGLAT